MVRTSIALGLLLAFSGCAKENKSDTEEKETTETTAASKTASEHTSATETDAEPTVEWVIERHIEALGGAERWASMKTMTFQATAGEGEEAMKIKVWRKRPNLMRAEIAGAEGTKIKLFDGEHGYKGTAEKLEKLDEKHAAGMAEHAKFDDVLFAHAERGHEVALAGEAEVDGKPAYELTITYDDEKKETRYLDAETFYEIKRVVPGYEGEEMVFTFSDYREVEGVVINHAYSAIKEGERHETVIHGFEIDQPIDDALFRVDPTQLAAAE